MEIILYYLGGTKVITKVLKSGRERQKSKSERCHVRKTPLVIAGFEDESGPLVKE